MPGDYTVTWVVDDSGARSFLARWPTTLDQFGRALCEGIVGDVKLELSKRPSPAPYGGPPGVDTGALRASITYTRKGHLTWWVHDQVEYGVYLELGRLNSRTGVHMTWPFMTPVFMRWRAKKAADLARRHNWTPGQLSVKRLVMSYG
jgi:hypothetical protein